MNNRKSTLAACGATVSSSTATTTCTADSGGSKCNSPPDGNGTIGVNMPDEPAPWKTMLRSSRSSRIARRRRGWCAATAAIAVAAWALAAAVPARARLSPLSTSRFASSWRGVPPPVFPTVKAANDRVLYSAVRMASGEGLGHAMATINADVNTALRLGVAYTHRVASHGSLTKKDARAVERFFGWGDGYIPRLELSRACKTYRARPSECVPCSLPGTGRAWSHGTLRRVVDIPINLTYTYYSRPRLQREYDLANFLKRNWKPGTLFQMPRSICDRSPAMSRFTREVRAHFHAAYWRGREREPSNPRIDERELVIAIHARRGDFFVAKRPMVRMEAFGKALREFARYVRDRGGPFARMRFAVLVFSEGVPEPGTGWRGHDVKRTRAAFLDVTGQPRDASWVRDKLVAGRPELFPAGIRVEMRVATDTLQAAHDMIAADVFLGSMSGLSTNVVGVLSRAAVIALPTHDPVRWPGQVHFDPSTGNFFDGALVNSSWIKYADRYAVHAARALLFGRVAYM